MKRLIAFFLTLALLVSCVPAALAAETEMPEGTLALLDEYETTEETTEATEEPTEETTEATEATEEATEAPTEATAAATETTEATEVTEAPTEATEETTAATEETTEATTEATTEETTEATTEETSALFDEEEPEEAPEEEEELDPAMAMLKSLTTEMEKAWSDAPTNIYMKQNAANKLYISWDASRYASSFVVYEVKYNSYGEATGLKKVGTTNNTYITISVTKGTHVYGIFPCSRTGGKGELGNYAMAAYNVKTQNWRKAPKITAQQDTERENRIIVRCQFVSDAVGYLLSVDDNVYVFDNGGAIVKEKCEIKNENAPKAEFSEPVIDKAVFNGFQLSVTFTDMDKFTNYPVLVTGAAIGVVDSENNLDYGKLAKTVKVKMTPQWVKAPKLSAKQTSAVEPEATLTVSFSGEPDYIRFYDGKDILGDVPVDEGETSFYVTYTLSTGNHSFKAVPIVGDGDYLYGGKASAAKKLKLKLSWMTDKIKVTAKETGVGQVRLSWPSMNGISQYEIWVKFGKSEVNLGNSDRTYEDIGQLQRGVKYTFTVKPVYNGGVGKGGSVSITPKLKARAQSPTYRALLIGNTYDGRLPGCDLDASSMASLLGTMTATPYKVTKKLNASASTIKSSIASAFSGAQSGDVSLFYYSGHGVSTSGSLVGNDYSTLSFSELRKALDKIPGDKIVILDSCYSGSAINKGGESDVAEADMEAYVNAAMEAFSNDAVEKSGELASGRYYVMTACRKDQTSLTVPSTSGRYVGLFTYCFEQACGWDELKSSRLSMSADSNSDKEITLDEAYNKTYSLVKEYADKYLSSTSSQVARVNPEGSDFVLFGRK